MPSELVSRSAFPVEAMMKRDRQAHARVAGIEKDLVAARRMTVEHMLKFGFEMTAMPLLDHCSPNEIIDDINAL